jgi:hypothetical protein
LRPKRFPAAIKLNDVIDVGVGRTRLKRDQFRHQFRHAQAAFRGALLERHCGVMIDFDNLVFI